MIYKQTSMIAKETIDALDIKNERIFRDMIHKLIEDMPMHTLEGIFRMSIIDPFSPKSEEKLMSQNVHSAIRNHILHLKEMLVCEFEVTYDNYLNDTI